MGGEVTLIYDTWEEMEFDEESWFHKPPWASFCRQRVTRIVKRLTPEMISAVADTVCTRHLICATGPPPCCPGS